MWYEKQKKEPIVGKEKQNEKKISTKIKLN